MHVATRRVQIAGLTPHPNEPWMTQTARNLTMTDVGFLVDHRYLIHDRDGKYCPAFDDTIKDGGVTPVRLPPRSPNLNAHAERWVRSVKDECLSKLILFGEPSLRTALPAYVDHFHGERNHQGKENLLLFPSAAIGQIGQVRCRERPGGLLKFSTGQPHEFLDNTRTKSPRKKPSACRSGRWKINRSVKAVSIATSEYRRCPPRVPPRRGSQPTMASGANQRVTSPRRRSARSYVGQFEIRYRVLYYG